MQSSDAATACNADQQHQQQQAQWSSTTNVKPQRPVIRLPSLLTNASNSSAASLDSSVATGKGCPPLLCRDVDGSSLCHDDGKAANAQQMPFRMQQAAPHSTGFKAPRWQPPSERPVHRLQAVTYSHAQQGSSIVQHEVTHRVSTISAAKIRCGATPARRRSSSNSEDTHQTAGMHAAECSAAAAATQPAEVSPPHAGEQRRQSGVSVSMTTGTRQHAPWRFHATSTCYRTKNLSRRHACSRLWFEGRSGVPQAPSGAPCSGCTQMRIRWQTRLTTEERALLVCHT